MTSERERDRAAREGDGATAPEHLADTLSLRNWGEPPARTLEQVNRRTVVDCGWGRLLFGQTFTVDDDIARELQREARGERDIALYIRDPQVTVARAPQNLFIDPSLTYRLLLERHRTSAPRPPLTIRHFGGGTDAEAMQRIYGSRHMAQIRDSFFPELENHDVLSVLLAEDQSSGDVVGCVTGVDHVAAFGDPDRGSSLWALAVDPQCRQPGVGRALVTALADLFRERGRSFMDLSVMHSNEEAISLYEHLGFQQVPVYCIKNRNAINEALYIGPRREDRLNPYAQIIVDEAHRRGISVTVDDLEAGLFTLSLGGQVIHCRESLSDATSAVAMSRCDDKALTRRLLNAAGLRTPAQRVLASEQDALAFLEENERIVLKPARGEQGAGVAVDLSTPEAVCRAMDDIRAMRGTVLGEAYVTGRDLRIIVINGEVVAAAERRPASIVGNGEHSARDLIQKQSRRRAAATGGESEIPMDEETLRCLADAGLDADDVPGAGREVMVRKTANLHTGGTIHDCTDALHPALADAALAAAAALAIPVVGLDFIVDDPGAPDYVIIEANERPGLANHEPQPTAQRFMDFLFPVTAEH